MKSIRNFCFLLDLLLLISCGNSEEPGIDCTHSDLSIDVASFVKSDCDQPGSITVSANGGEGDYLYSIDGQNFRQEEKFDGLFAGNFNLLVQDAIGCTATTSFTLESELTGITMSLEATNSDCGSDTGSITVAASGGTGELEFSIDGSVFSTNTNYSNISPGSHMIVAIDEEGCSVTKTVQVLTNVSLENDIMPIVMNDCAITGCHNGSQTPRLATKDEVIQNASRIKSETQSRSMPRDGQLTQNEIDLIACWVDDGALKN